MDKQPKLMSISRMRDILEPHMELMHRHIFINHELAIVYGNPRAFRLVLRQQPPFVINDHRLGIIVRGDIMVNINLVEKHLMAGTLVFIGPGTIINPVSISDDLEIYGIGLAPDFPMPFAPGQLPAAFNGQVRDFQLRVDDADLATARHIIDALWHVVHQKDYHHPTVSSLVAAQMHHYDGLYSRYVDSCQQLQSREQTIFDRFITLVNQHCLQEHQIAYYASRMCLTERYLGTIVRQTTGVTAKEWIDRALVMRAQVELRHTDKTVAQISDSMNFPNPSFFCKYFRRLTGLTPSEFRET
ncbi:MAG: AraC family transcriptional regulator [Prevotella sp.]|nr:AraC family transcriptional regulator [Prevotella sp.]